MYDVIIIGAGPAGSVLAKELGKHFSVLLIDQRRFTGPAYAKGTEKCCGGLLDPSAQQAFASLKIALPVRVLQSPQVFSIRALDFDNQKERYYPKHYLNIDRVELDRYLFAGACEEKGVTALEETTFLGYQEEEDAVEVKVRRKGSCGQQSFRARYLVGADGAASAVRRIKGQDPGMFCPAREYACLQQWFETDRDSPYFVAAFDRYVTDFYSWMIPKNGRVIVGSAIPKSRDVRFKFTVLKAELMQAGFALGEPVYESGAVLLRPWPYGSVDSGQGRVLLIGEAAGLISPSSAEGVSYAVRSAVCLARAFEEHGKRGVAAEYDRRLWKLKASIGVKSAKSPVMYNPFLRGLVFDSRLLSIETEKEE